MAATIEKAKQDDPKELRRIIRELERKVKTPQVSVDVDAIRYGYEKAASDNDIRVRRIVASVNESVSGLAALAEKICSQLSGLLSNSVPPRIEPVRRSVREPINHRSESPTNVSSNGSLPKGERIVLTAIAQHGTASREQLTVLTGYKRSSRDAYIQRLKERGYVESSGADVTATDIGVSALGSDYEPLPTGRELRDYWHNRLPEGERVFFDLLVDRYPNGLTRDELTDQSEYKRSSRDAYLQRLKAKKLVTTSGSMVTAAEHLF